MAATTGEAQTQVESTTAELPRASGSFVLMQADVDVDTLTSLRGGGATSLWQPGPMLFAGGKDGSEQDEDVLSRQREESLGAELSPLVHGKGRRFHRVVNHRFHSVGTEKPDRALRVTGFEVVAADHATYGREDVRGADKDGGATRWTPGVVVVHIGLPSCTDEDGATSSDLWSGYLSTVLEGILKGDGAHFCATIEELLGSEHSEAIFVQPSTARSFTNVSPPVGATVAKDSANVEPDVPTGPVRVIGSPSNTVLGEFPLYWVLADVCCTEEFARKRRKADRDGRNQPIEGADERSEDELGKLRSMCSRGLAELSKHAWNGTDGYFEGGREPEQSALNWWNWHATFGQDGAGFSFIPAPTATKAWPYRRNHLSGSFADVMALELLTDRILGRFSEHARDLAAELRTKKDPNHRRALDIWKEFAVFTTEYVSRTSGLSRSHAEFRDAFRAGLARENERDLRRTQDNLDRIAEITRMEQAEARRVREEEQAGREKTREAERRSAAEDQAKRDRDQAEIERRRAGTERKFNLFIGVIATILLPLSIIPSVLEWYYPNPDPSTTGVRWIIVLAGVVVTGLVLGFVGRNEIQQWWKARAEQSEPGDSEEGASTR